MVFLLEHVMLLVDCPVFKSDLFIHGIKQKKPPLDRVTEHNIHM